MRESPSEGVFGAGTLGYIRFFWPSHQICLEDFLIEVVLSALLVTLQFHALNALHLPLFNFMVFSTNLFPGTFGEVSLDEAEISAVQLDKLFRCRDVPPRTWSNPGQSKGS